MIDRHNNHSKIEGQQELVKFRSRRSKLMKPIEYIRFVTKNMSL